MYAYSDADGLDRVIVAAAIAGALFSLSIREGTPWPDVGGAVAVIVGAVVVVQEATVNAGGIWALATTDLLLGALIAVCVLYLVRAIPAGAALAVLRRRILGGSALGWSAVAAVLAMDPDETAVAGSLVLAAAAVRGVWEVTPRLRRPASELAFLVVIAAAQRIAWLAVDGMSLFWAAQWWVVALAVLAAFCQARRLPRRGSRWLIVAAAILSGSGLLTVLGGTTAAQVWALCGHILLLVVGAALSRRLFSLWGAIGIVLALLWFLRGFTFLLLAVAALLLLAFAVWKLNSQTRGGAGPSEDMPPDGPLGGRPDVPLRRGPSPGGPGGADHQQHAAGSSAEELRGEQSGSQSSR